MEITIGLNTVRDEYVTNDLNEDEHVTNIYHNTVRSRYLTVIFLWRSHDSPKLTNEGEVWGVVRGCKVCFTIVTIVVRVLSCYQWQCYIEIL